MEVNRNKKIRERDKKMEMGKEGLVKVEKVQRKRGTGEGIQRKKWREKDNN